MSPVPLLLPTAVVSALATGIGAAVASRRPPMALVGAGAGLVPALLAWAVLSTSLGQLWTAPLVFVALFAQIGFVVILGRVPLRGHLRASVVAAGMVSALGAAAVGVGLYRARAVGTSWSAGDCVESTIPGGASTDLRCTAEGCNSGDNGDGMTIRSLVLGPQAPPQWGPFSCVVDITNARGVTRRQLRSATPTQLSGNVSCPATSILSCPSARILIVESTAYRMESLVITASTPAGNLAALGVPLSCLALALIGTCAALGLFVVSLSRFRVPHREDPNVRGSPYRSSTLEDPLLTEAPGARRLAFVAVALASGSIAPLATALLLD
jgi:hypothetical protein